MKRRLSIVASTLLVGVTTAVFAGGAPAGAQVPAAQADYKGYSTGTVVHADALTVGTTRVLDTEVAFSGASVASKGTGGVTRGPGAASGSIVNEMEQVVQPALPNTNIDANLRGDRVFGRGSGLELGVGTTVSQDVNANQLLLAQRALASGPPSSNLIRNEVGPIKIDPAAFASLVRGEAQVRWDGDNVCSLGEPLSYGLGYAADAQLLNLGAASPGNEPFPDSVLAADAPEPERSVSQSRSITRLVPQTDAQGNKIGDNFGLMTETRMTIAPITLLENTASPITIELLGEWVLRSVATGLPGQAYVTYGPGAVTPDTPVLRIIQGLVPSTVLSLQDLLGSQGLPIDIPGIASIVVGEDPRAIGGNASSAPTQGGDGTVASGAVDAVRVQLLDGSTIGTLVPGLSALDVRVGHMEAHAQVPAGGIRCNVPVSKTADKQTVNAGDTFTYNINVTNPFADCDLTEVRVVDNISVTNGVRYSITGTNPQASSTTSNQVTWNDIGPIGPKQTRTVSITVAVAANSAAGQFTNNATATGNCATGSAQGGARISVPISGDTTVVLPSVGGGRELPATGVDVLPRTGLSGPAMAFAGLGLLGAAMLLRRLRAAAVRP